MPDPSSASKRRLDELLKELHDDLRAVGMPVQHLEGSEGPGPGLASLVIGVPPDAGGRERTVSLAFVPDEDEFEAVDLIQLYLPLPASRELPDLAAVNERAIVGHMGVQSNGEVYYRMMWPVPRGLPLVPSVLIETLQLFVAASDMALAGTDSGPGGDGP